VARRPALETAVMEALWQVDGWLTPGELQERLAPDHRVAYNTVATVLARLGRKGRVERRRRDRAYEYRATVSRDDHLAARIEEVLTTASDRSAALARFVEELSQDERRRLRRRLGPG